MRNRGLTFVELVVVIAIMAVLLGVAGASLGNVVTKRRAARFPGVLATMIESLPPLAQAKQATIDVKRANGYVYVALDSVTVVPVTTRVKVPYGVSFSGSNTLLAAADPSGYVSTPENPIHIVVNGDDVYLHVGAAGDVNISNTP